MRCGGRKEFCSPIKISQSFTESLPLDFASHFVLPFRGERMDRGAWIWAFWVPKLLVSDNIPADCCFIDKLCFTLTDPKDFSLPGSSVHGIFPGKHIGVGCHFLLQGIFLTQGSNTSLLQWLVDSLQLSHQGIVN